MTNSEKETIKQMFVDKCQLLGISQNQAAILAGTKGATISQVLNGKYNADDAAIYKLIGIWVGYFKNDWQFVETRAFNFISSLITDSRENHEVYALIGEAGCGKTSTAQYHANNQRGVVYVQCVEFWSRKQFLKQVLAAMGRENSGMGIAEMVESIVDGLANGDNTLILDEADKLADSVFIFFITLYNRLEDRAGIIMMATPHLMKRISHGVELNRKGYNEIWSRVGRKYVVIPKPSKSDIASIANHNGIESQEQIKDIIEHTGDDFRRTKRLIHKHKLINAKAFNL